MKDRREAVILFWWERYGFCYARRKKAARRGGPPPARESADSIRWGRAQAQPSILHTTTGETAREAVFLVAATVAMTAARTRRAAPEWSAVATPLADLPRGWGSAGRRHCLAAVRVLFYIWERLQSGVFARLRRRHD